MRQRLILPENHWLQMEPAPPRPCPYLPKEQMQLDIGIILPKPNRFDELLASGYRRLGQVFYRPSCLGCRKCIPIRVATSSFSRSKSQRRIWKKHSARYQVTLLPPVYQEDHYLIYEKHSTHVSRENEPSDPEGYMRAFLLSQVQTHIVEYRIDEQLIGATIIDVGKESVSSVYAFWDPDLPQYSMGTFSALWEIAWAQNKGLRYYYLGYFVDHCPSMSYKRRFRPHQLFDWKKNAWV